MDPAKIPSFRQSLSFDPNVLPKKKSKFKNLALLEDDPVSRILEEFDPVQRYLDDLEVS
jgi:hypothetical protein